MGALLMKGWKSSKRPMLNRTERAFNKEECYGHTNGHIAYIPLSSKDKKRLTGYASNEGHSLGTADGR
jgi:hypothetical protein